MSHLTSLLLPFAYKKTHYLCKWLLNVQLPNRASTYIVSMCFLPAVMSVQFWKWIFKVKQPHSYLWPLKVWLCTRDWSICKNTFHQHLDKQQSKFYRKNTWLHMVLKTGRAWKNIYLTCISLWRPRHKSCMTTILWTISVFSH